MNPGVENVQSELSSREHSSEISHKLLVNQSCGGCLDIGLRISDAGYLTVSLAALEERIALGGRIC